MVIINFLQLSDRRTCQFQIINKSLVYHNLIKSSYIIQFLSNINTNDHMRKVTRYEIIRSEKLIRYLRLRTMINFNNIDKFGLVKDYEKIKKNTGVFSCESINF